MTKAKSRVRAHTRPAPSHPKSSDDASAHYHREKARRARRTEPQSELMAAARREYLALLEAEAAKGKGGRPKKKPAKPANDESDTDEQDEANEDEAGDE